MLRRLLTVIAILAVALAAAGIARAAAPGERSFIALCYHGVEDRDPDQTFVGVSTDRLGQQLGWLQQNGYQFVSLDDVLAARDGVRPLPDKAVLLTFDDGLASFYTRAFPILKAFRAPAVLALVGAWMDGGAGSTVTGAGLEGKPTTGVEYGN